MNQLTIRGLGPELERKVRNLAAQEGISLNQAVLRLLKKGAGVESVSKTAVDRVGSALAPFIGSWSKEQSAEIEEALEVFEQVEPSFWS